MPNESTPPVVSIVLPCLNESQVLTETVRRVSEVCRALLCTSEIVLVNDGSLDDTWSIMQRLAAADATIVAVNLSRNHGHQLALSAGLWAARGDRILIMDADLQDPPELLPEMLQMMDRGVDVVYAQRRTRYGDSLSKRIFCSIYYRIAARLADRPAPLDTGDFRLISRRIRDLLVEMPERSRYIRGMVSWLGFRQEPVFYDRDARFAGETKYPFTQLLSLAMNGILSTSVRPLAVAWLLGGIAMILCGLFLLYALASWIFVGTTPQGWTSLMFAIIFMGGIQMLMLGVIGEYLGRLVNQSRMRPMFLVDSIVRNGGTVERIWPQPDGR